MTKKQHDEFCAELRSVDCEKSWFQQCARIIQNLGMRKFRVLDVGCGNGEMLSIMSDQFDSEVVGLDYSEHHLRAAQSRSFGTIKCNFDNDDEVDRVGSENEDSFDLVVSLEVIEHIFGTDRFLMLCHRVLRPSGLMIISTPNISTLSFYLYSMFRGMLFFEQRPPIGMNILV